MSVYEVRSSTSASLTVYISALSGRQSVLQAADDADGVCGRTAGDALLRLLHPPEDLGGKNITDSYSSEYFTSLTSVI